MAAASGPQNHIIHRRTPHSPDSEPCEQAVPPHALLSHSRSSGLENDIRRGRAVWNSELRPMTGSAA